MNRRRMKPSGTLPAALLCPWVLLAAPFILLATPLVLLAAKVEARPIHYGAVDSEEVLACDQLQWTGQTESAKSCYQALLAQSQPHEVQAEAHWALGDLQQANNLFSTALQSIADEDIYRTSRVLSRWGDLYLETHQLQDALDLFVRAGELLPKNEHAAIGAAIVLLSSGDPSAGDYLNSIVVESEKNSGAKLQALLTMASLRIRSGQVNEAEELLAEATELAERAGFPMLEIYALHAGIDVRRNSDPGQWISRALEINPAYGDAYAIPAFFYVITFKYDQAGDFYQKAVDIEPDHYHAHLELGANHLRQNRSSLAREHFTIAYQGDPFNPEAVNSMRLMDTYDSFDVLNFPEASEAATLPELSIRLDRSERDLLAPYASELALQAIATFEERYRFRLKQTAHLEIYPNHDDFIVRALGMPGTPLLGVAFGYLVAMDSPSAKTGGDYHWGTTLWHEIAHIFTIKASNHNVPRWFSEGVSVYEEWQTGPLSISAQDSAQSAAELEPGAVRIPLHVYGSLLEEEFLSIEELDSGFSSPKYENQVLVSYNQAGLICDFVVREFGFDHLVRMLDAYAQAMSTVEVVQSVLGLSVSQFDEQFADYFDRTQGDTLGSINKWMGLVQDANQALIHEKWQLAIEASDQAIEIMPDYSDSDSPYLIKAQALEKLDDTDARFATLETFWLAGGYEADSLKQLALDYMERDQAAQAIRVLSDVNLVDPFDLNVHLDLGDLLLQAGDARQALREYRVAMALDPLDKAEVHYRMGNAHKGLGDAEQARSQALAALDIAPHFRPAQRLLMETLGVQRD